MPSILNPDLLLELHYDPALEQARPLPPVPNAASPATDMAARLLAGPEGDEIRAQSPFGRVATPAEIAAAVVYLASPEAEWASGAILDLNGASYLRT